MGASATRPSAEPAIAVAVSGGRDSTALLHATARAAATLGVRVIALHVHHGLNREADAWAAHVQRQGRRWGLAVHVHRLDGTPAAGDSVEAWARRERYAALASMARAAACDAVLLAHHRRDQAETVLLQLLRGAGARGLAAMPAQLQRHGIQWLRPWLDQPRELIEAYVRRHRLRHVDDASNADPRHARNGLRQRVWPALQTAFPGAEAALALAARRAAEEAACLRELAVLDGNATLCDQALVVAAWATLTPARQANLLRHQIEGWTGQGAPETLVQRLLAELPQARQGRWPAPGGELRLYRGRLLFVPATAKPVPAPTVLDLRRAGRHPAPGGHWQVERVARGGIALDRLRSVQAGPRREGLQFQRHAAGPARQLKKQFQALAVPVWARDGPVLQAADGALLYVAGLGIDARAVAATGEPQCVVSWVPDASV